MAVDEIKEKELMVRLIQAIFPGAKVYLFGSRAKGTNRPSSDIDLAIDANRKLDLFERGLARNILECLYIPYKIDVVDLYSIPEELKETILREGILWTN